MPQWKTTDIVDDLKEVLNDPQLRFKVNPSGGDVDTEHIVIQKDSWEEEDRLTVCGFQPDHNVYLDSSANADVPCVELRNFDSDSDGGVQSTDEDLVLTSVRIKSILKQNGLMLLDVWMIISK